ncbi:MAG: hypothetical protein KME57_19080 [Scytonema hyalinum WJT4-NPBG1]|jgi:guanyl-specific ribonuclease Sa|nr:hypothetical protein [Scytonema hyalinum WJT4-NPBG1]
MSDRDRMMLGRKKAQTSTLTNSSLTSPTSPTLANPTRGFGLQADTASPKAVDRQSSNLPEAQLSEKEAFKPSFGHDISRISLRPQAKLTVSEPGQELIAHELTHVMPQTAIQSVQPESTTSHDLQTKIIQRTLYGKGDPKGVTVPSSAITVASQVGSARSIKVKVGKSLLPGLDIGGTQYVGNRPYGNRSGDLPAGVTYTEYDVNPYTGKNRGTDRIVIGSDGKKYYTNNHYTDFTEF